MLITGFQQNWFTLSTHFRDTHLNQATSKVYAKPWYRVRWINIVVCLKVIHTYDVWERHQYQCWKWCQVNWTSHDHAKNLTSCLISDVYYALNLSYNTSQCDAIIPQHHKAMANLPKYEDKSHRYIIQQIEVCSITYISISKTKHENMYSSGSFMKNLKEISEHIRCRICCCYWKLDSFDWWQVVYAY